MDQSQELLVILGEICLLLFQENDEIMGCDDFRFDTLQVMEQRFVPG
jgi:hypothetical protein